MKAKASTSVGALTAGRPDHVVDVTVAGDSILVTPDYVLIHAGESVQWRFRGIQDARRPEIRFINPVGMQCGPFRTLSVGCCPDPAAADGARIYTITGMSADTIRRTYEYEAGVVAANGVWVGKDPIIENDGPPRT